MCWGTSALPWCPGSAGSYGAARALALTPPEARAVGLERVEITTEPDNFASPRTIERNGGRLVELVNPIDGPEPKLRYVIDLRELPHILEQP